MGCKRYWDQFPESLLKPRPSRQERTHGPLPGRGGLGRPQHQGKAAPLRAGPAPECRDGRLPRAPLLLPVVLPLSPPCPHQNCPPPSPPPTKPADAEVLFP